MKEINEETLFDARDELFNNGYSIIDGLFLEYELLQIEKEISSLPEDGDSFLKTNDLFAIRQFLRNAPDLRPLLFNQKMKELLTVIGGDDYFLTKAIYFDKPKGSNWFVSYHQDLSISVDIKAEIEGYENWTQKRGQFGVIPPVEILENSITLRIHLDDTTQDNGALKVIPKSHSKGVVRKEENTLGDGVVCNVKRGGVMLMKPLTMHASGRSKGKSNRRVIHLEVSNKELQKPLEWLEKSTIFAKAN